MSHLFETNCCDSLKDVLNQNELSFEWFNTINASNGCLRKCFSCTQIHILNKRLHKTKAKTRINRSVSWDEIKSSVRKKLLLKLIDISTLNANDCQLKLFCENSITKSTENVHNVDNCDENFKNRQELYNQLKLSSVSIHHLKPSDSSIGDDLSPIDVSPNDYSPELSESVDEIEWESDCNTFSCDNTYEVHNKCTTISKCKTPIISISAIDSNEQQLPVFGKHHTYSHRSNSCDSAIILPFIDTDSDDNMCLKFGSESSKLSSQTNSSDKSPLLNTDSERYSDVWLQSDIESDSHSSGQLGAPSVVISDHSTDHEERSDTTCDEKESVLALAIESYFTQSSHNLRRDSISSISSSTSSLSSLGEEDFVEHDFQTTCKLSPISAWRKVRSLVTSPFIQTYKKQKYPWVQLAGHQGNFLCGQTQGTILKKLNGTEETCFKLITNDVIKPLVPEYLKTIDMNNDSFLELEDLLAKFENPSIMDVKMGVRTYLEDELTKARVRPKLRKDMYEKMIAIDPLEPTEEENTLKAVTKPRYMIWRETISSTASLGFRIEGIKQSNGKALKDFKRTKTEDNVKTAFRRFMESHPHYGSLYLNKLIVINETIKLSQFFANHEIIGSSLLFVHDDKKADIWLIDFAKTYPLPNGIRISHRNEWQVGNHEDGYLIGLENLIRIFTNI